VSKFWSPSWGLGDLDYKPARAVFTPDDGADPITILWIESRTGQGNQKSMPRRKAERAEWERWISMVTRIGQVHSFRRGGAP
jgi:hypothetical protein